MAIIACPECGQEASDKARACPSCGLPASEFGKPADDAVKLHIVRHGRSWSIEPKSNGWIFLRTFPTKWKAELALAVWAKGRRPSDYFSAARKHKPVKRAVPGSNFDNAAKRAPADKGIEVKPSPIGPNHAIYQTPQGPTPATTPKTLTSIEADRKTPSANLQAVDLRRNSITKVGAEKTVSLMRTAGAILVGVVAGAVAWIVVSVLWNLFVLAGDQASSMNHLIVDVIAPGIGAFLGLQLADKVAKDYSLDGLYYGFCAIVVAGTSVLAIYMIAVADRAGWSVSDWLAMLVTPLGAVLGASAARTVLRSTPWATR